MEKNFKQINSECVKVVFYGPESSGKTTLCFELSKYYGCLWVEEFARNYLQKKWDNERKICELKDILPIAKGQINLENKLSLKSSELLLCDTDLLVTKVYSETYFNGFCDSTLNHYATNNKYDLYVLTDIDIPWVKDDLRDKPNERQKMFDIFKNTLDNYNKPYIIVSGSLKNRTKIAKNAIDNLLK